MRADASDRRRRRLLLCAIALGVAHVGCGEDTIDPRDGVGTEAGALDGGDAGVAAADGVGGDGAATDAGPDGVGGDGAAIDAGSDVAAGDVADAVDDAVDGGAGDDGDAGILDVAADTAGAADGTGADAMYAGSDADACAAKSAFDYACDPTQPKTCPGGMCAFGFCIGPKLDPDRWKACGDGVCAPCEGADACPVDCGKAPTLSGAKQYSGAKTVTVWVHGFTNKDPKKIAKMVYGDVKGCGDLLENLALFGVTKSCGGDPKADTAPDHMVSVEYYGAVAPAWMSAADKAEVEAWPYDKGAMGLHRYALIVAKFARWRMDKVGATHVQFACHSMGCLITRHLIEHDLEQLASEQKIVRWATSTGVIAGARLARLYDNPAIQQGAAAIGLELSDFVLMNPDHVLDTTAKWDHQLYEANNPLFAGIWMHHAVATDPKIAQALNIQLLDLNNPGDEPNDGIMYTLDQHFHGQKASGVSVTKSGVALPSTRSYAYFDHMANPSSLAAAVVAAAGLFHKRKVRVVLESLELYDDLEADGPFDFKNQGAAPAEVAVEVAVRYDPWLKATYGKDVLVSEQRVAHRSAEVFVAAQGKVAKPELVVFAGPVFDAQPSLRLQMSLLEVDWYPRFGVLEWLPDPHELLLAVDEIVPLTDGKLVFANALAKATLRVELHELP